MTISRCSNNYEPYQFPEKLIPLIIVNALADKPLPVYGQGQDVQDWLYVEDHCKAIDLILQKGRIGEVYNVGGHNEMRNVDIVKPICAALGKPESLIAYVTDCAGHDVRYAIDPTKIQNELGLLLETCFAEESKDYPVVSGQPILVGTIVSGEYRDYYKKCLAIEYAGDDSINERNFLIYITVYPHVLVRIVLNSDERRVTP